MIKEFLNIVATLWKEAWKKSPAQVSHERYQWILAQEHYSCRCEAVPHFEIQDELMGSSGFNPMIVGIESIVTQEDADAIKKLASSIDGADIIRQLEKALSLAADILAVDRKHFDLGPYFESLKRFDEIANDFNRLKKTADKSCVVCFNTECSCRF